MRRRRGRADRHGSRRSRGPWSRRLGMRFAAFGCLLSRAMLTQVVEGPQHGVQERLRTRRPSGVRILLCRHGNLHGPPDPAHSQSLPLPVRLLRVRHGSCAASGLVKMAVFGVQCSGRTECHCPGRMGAAPFERTAPSGYTIAL